MWTLLNATPPLSPVNTVAWSHRLPAYSLRGIPPTACNCGTGEREGWSLVHGEPSLGVEQKIEGGAWSAGGGAPVWSKRLGAGLGAREAEPWRGARCWGRAFEGGRRSPSV